MGFSADTIGFYLQVDDQLSGTLESAADAYKKFVGQLEKWNKFAFKSSSKGLDALSELVKGFEALPEQAESSYREALQRLQDRIKPLTQPINVVFSARSRKEIQKAIGDAVSKAMSDVKLRLHATMPATKLGYFDTSASMKALYKHLAQPPDMKGKLEPKHFKQGGPVTGGTPGKDSVLSLLEPGEFVLPKDIAKQMGTLQGASGKFVSPKDISESIAHIQNLGKAVGKLKDALDAGLGSPDVKKLYAKGMADLNLELAKLTKSSSHLSTQQQVKLVPALRDSRSEMEKLKLQTDETGKATNNLLEKILGPARFLALNTALHGLIDGLKGVKDAGLSLGGDQIESFTDNMNQANRTLHLSRKELSVWKAEMSDVSWKNDLNPNELSESFEGLLHAGIRDLGVFKKLTPLVTNFGRATSTSWDTAAAAAGRLSSVYELTEGQVAAVFDDMTRAQGSYSADASEMTGDLIKSLEMLGPSLLKETTGVRTTILRSLAGLTAATRNAWTDTSGELTSWIVQGISDPMSKTAQDLQASIGMTIDEIRGRLKSGKLDGMFDQLAAKVASLGDNQAGLKALHEQLGFPGTVEQLAVLGKGIDNVNSSAMRFQKEARGVADASEAIAATASDTKTWADSLKTGVANLMNMTGLGKLVDLSKELDLPGMAAGFYLIRESAKGLASVWGTVGTWFKGAKDGAKAIGEVASATSSVASATSGAAGAVGTGGFFAGLSAGLSALAVGVTTLGTALLSPVGIAFTVSFAVLMLALGATLMMAQDPIRTFGKVVETAINAAVSAFGLFVPVLLRIVDVAGGVFMAAINGIVTVLTTLFHADWASLLTAGPALFLLAGGLYALSLAVVGYGAALGGAAIGALAFRLASGGDSGLTGGVLGFVESLTGSLDSLQQSAPARLEALTASLRGMLPFIDAYAALADRIQSLPSGGLFGGLFGGNPAEKFKEQAGPLLQAISEVMLQTQTATSMHQPRVTATVTPSQVQSAIDAVFSSPTLEDMRDAATRTNELLAKILTTLIDTRTATPEVAPQRTSRPSNPSVTDTSRSIAGFGY